MSGLNLSKIPTALQLPIIPPLALLEGGPRGEAFWMRQKARPLAREPYTR